MKKVETLLPEELIESLSAEAKEKGIHRSDLIRERLKAKPDKPRVKPSRKTKKRPKRK